MYEHGADSGWWHGPYSTGGDSHEGILRNTFALKNAVGMLAENRASGGTTRPAEGHEPRQPQPQVLPTSTRSSRRSSTTGRTARSCTTSCRTRSRSTRANVGPVVTRGSYPWPYNRSTVPTPVSRIPMPLTPDHIIDPPPCGYFLTEEQYSGPLTGGTVGLRLGLHGIAQETRRDGHVVRLAQPQRGLIPTLFDQAAVSPEPIVVGTRLFECPYVTVAPSSFSTTAVEETETTETLTIGNQSPDADEPLDWTITEAVSDCSIAERRELAQREPDLGHDAGRREHGSRHHLLGRRTNRAGRADGRAVPGQQRRRRGADLDTRDAASRYPFGGFLSPVHGPPALNSRKAGSATP